MKTKLELAKLSYEYLGVISNGYETSDFTQVFPLLAEDCILESQLGEENKTVSGYEAVVLYFSEVRSGILDSASFPSCTTNEFVEWPEEDGLGKYYPECDFCLIIEQENGDEMDETVLRIQLNEDEKISHIIIGVPESFQVRCFYTVARLVPGSDDSEIDEAEIFVSDDYGNELYLFLGMADIAFDEYDDIQIPMDKWQEALSYWERFYSFETFDEAFEDACGIDYKTFTIEDEETRDYLSYNGEEMWSNRYNSKNMLSALVEWTEKYKHTCDFINNYGS